MKNEKMIYQTPKIEIVLLTAGDMLTASSGYDGVDNWANDIFGG